MHSLVLDSISVAVTGARKGQELVNAFERRGATVHHAPMLSGDHPATDAEIAEDTRLILDLQPQWVVATTGIGMRLWLEAAKREGLHQAVLAMMGSTRCVARSAKAQAGLAAAGIKPDWVAPKETDATVVAWLATRGFEGDGVAVQLHGGHPRAYTELQMLGMDVMSVLPYRTGPPEDSERSSALVQLLNDGMIDVLTFTSPGAVRNLVTIASTKPGGVEQLQDVVRERTAVAAVGPVTAGACEDLGLVVRISPARYRSMDLVREVEAWADRREWDRPTHVVMSASESTATIAGVEVALGKREYLVLAMLARRSGAVCRTEELLVQGWAHEQPDDPGTVKHQISRLRRKLDGTSVQIETVRSVGYRLTHVT